MKSKTKYFWKVKQQFLTDVKIINSLFGKELEGNWIDTQDNNKIKRCHIYKQEDVEVIN